MDQDFPAPNLDVEWLRQARAGDREAFAALYRQHSTAVYTLALRLSAGRSEAEDLTQETFLRALQGLHGVREDLPIRPWLKRIAANLAIDHHRRGRPLDGSVESLDVAVEGAVAADGIDLSTLLARLDPVVRSVLWLALVEGWSHRELAERYGRSESWSKSLLSRALARLKLECPA